MGLINKEVWDSIESNLGTIADFQISESTESKRLPFKITYTTNGLPKTIYFSDYKLILQSLIYCCKENNPIKI